ncbi:hypothetical protein [Microbacterium testaceum]|uniref:hypothetical protein n=1 Tax=Microbacterium testaceum TaxID=2033 RepID=UPI00128EB9F3|nr:hypothetical protein [Microbacterium testaceum]
MTMPLPDDEVLRRQVHPTAWHPSEPKIDSSAFKPRKNEPDGRISCMRAAVDPADAWKRYSGGDERRSAGTFGVRVDEASEVGCGAGDDSHEPDKPADHAFIEVRPDERSITRKARALAAYATARGPLFTP